MGKTDLIIIGSRDANQYGFAFHAMIENGQKVKIHYTGTLDDGNQFDSSAGRNPLEFEMGAGMVIPGFETGAKDMAVGEKNRSTFPLLKPMEKNARRW